MGEVRPGGLAVVLWAALTALGCIGPNPAYQPGVDAGGGGTGGGSGGDGGADRADTASPGADTSGVEAGTPDLEDDASPPPPDALPPDSAPDAPLPPDLAPDMTPPPPDLAPDLPPPDTTPPLNLDLDLRAHWTFNEGSGTRVADRMGNNTGTLQAGASFVRSGIPNASATNYAARFQGTDDHMTISIQSLPSLQSQKTIALWILPAVLTHTDMRTILAFANSDESTGIQIGTDGGRPAVWRWGQMPGMGLVRSNRGDLTSGWHHVLYTYDGQRHQLYVDGVAAGSSTDAGASGTIANAVLACYDKDDLGWEMYVGQLDDLRVYDRVLTAPEIARLAQGE